MSAKDFSSKEDFIHSAAEILDEIHHHLLERSTSFRDANITPCDSLEAFHAHWTQENPGWLHTPWAGTPGQEDELSKRHKITIRCLPLASVPLPPSPGGKCFLTGNETATRALWGRSY